MTQEEKELFNAANAYAFDLDCGDLNTNRDAFIAGAEWMASLYEKVEGEHLNWYSYHDHEYMCGFRFDEPVELPAEVYVKKNMEEAK